MITRLGDSVDDQLIAYAEANPITPTLSTSDLAAWGAYAQTQGNELYGDSSTTTNPSFVSASDLLAASSIAASASNPKSAGPTVADITGGQVGGSAMQALGNALSSLFGGSGVSNPKIIQPASATTTFVNPLTGKVTAMDTSSVTIYALLGVMGIILISSLMSGGKGRR